MLIPFAEFYSRRPARYPQAYMKKWETSGVRGDEHFTPASDRNDLLEHYQHPDLDGGNANFRVRRWLETILLWGNDGPRMLTRFRSPRKGCQDDQLGRLRTGIREMNAVPADAVTRLRTWEISHFTMVSYGSKLLMFLNPKMFVVLDSNVIRALKNSLVFPRHVFQDEAQWQQANAQLTGVSATALRVATPGNESYSWTEATIGLYAAWCQCCRVIAAHAGGDWYASDIERLYFACAEPPAAT